MGRLDCHILLETRQRVVKSARKPERPAREDTLAIVNVVQHLANRPLSRRVRVKTPLLGDPAEKLEHLAHLVLDRGDDVVAGYKINVFEIVVRCFGRFWSCHLAGNPNKNRRITQVMYPCTPWLKPFPPETRTSSQLRRRRSCNSRGSSSENLSPHQASPARFHKS